MWPPPIGALGGAPYGATKRRTGCGGRMWPPPLRPQAELPIGPRSAVLGVADACGVRWSPTSPLG
eukprot:3063841-Pyramimonas_sp.AAC.1